MDLLPAFAIPALFALLHAVGLILSLVFWRRCPSACALLLGASLLHLLSSGSRIALIFLRGDVPAFMGAIFGGLAILSWFGYALMLMAVFAGRNEPTRLPPRTPRSLPEDDDDDWDTRKTLPLPPTGIQKK